MESKLSTFTTGIFVGGFEYYKKLKNLIKIYSSITQDNTRQCL